MTFGIDDKKMVGDAPALLKTDRADYVLDGYELLLPGYKRSVSDVDSLIAVVIEEAKRAGNATGEFMTVSIRKNGAYFHPDDRKRVDTWEFLRQESEPFKALANKLNSPMNHKQFMTFLTRMRPYLGESFSEVFRDYRRVNTETATSASSSPVLVDGGTKEDFCYEITFKDAGKQPLRASFWLRLPYVAMDVESRWLDVRVDVEPEFTTGKELKLNLVAPELPELQDAYLQGEAERLKAALEAAKLTDVLIVNNL